MPGTEYTRNQILTQNTNDFPNNNAGLITPAILRDYNANVANSVLFLNETGSHATSASYALSASYANNASTSNTSTSASYALTASYALNAAAAVNTGSLLLTASAATNVITFTKGDSSTFSITVDTGSATTVNTGSLMVTGSVLNNTLTFTKGDNTTFSLTVNTGSAASVNTGSLLVTASVSNDIITFTKGNNTTFDITVNNVKNSVSSSVVSIGGDFTNASRKVVFVGTTGAAVGEQLLINSNTPDLSYNPSTNILTTTASFANSIPSNLNITASNILVNNNLIVNGTASFNNVVTVSGSAVVIGDEFLVLNANPPIARYAGILVYDSGSATTASIQWDGLNDNWIIVEETGLSALILTGPTGSKGSEVAPTVNTLLKGTGNHTVGNSNITDNGTVVKINSNTQVTGSVSTTGDINMVNGTNLVTHHVKAPAVNGVEIQNNSGGVVGLFGAGGSLGTTFYGQVNATAFSGSGALISGVVSSSYALTASFALNAGTSINTGSFATTGSNIFTGGQVVQGLTLGTGGGGLYYNTVFGSGSLALNTIAEHNTALGYRTLEKLSGSTAEGNTAVGSEALRDATSSIYNTGVGFQAGKSITTGGSNVLVGSQAGSNITTGNGNTIIGANTNPSSATTNDTLIIAVGGNFPSTTGSKVIEGTIADGLQIRTGLTITGSVTATGSFISVNGMKGADLGAPSADIWAVSNQYPDYGIFFLEGLANDFYEFRSAGTPTVQIDPDNGRVIASQFTGSLNGTATSASFAQTASFLSGIPTSASYALTASFVNPLNQPVVFSGSIRGEVNALSIASNTASLNCSLDNFFTLQLVQGTNTYINPTNVNNGQTINILVNTTGSATVSFPSTVKQVSGNSYTPTSTTGKDVLTLISFADSNLYLVNVKNLV